MTRPNRNFMDRFREELEREAGAAWERSSLAEWMTTHHGEGAQLLNDPNVDWSLAAALFAAQGLRDQAGRPPTARTARETWKRVAERRKAAMKLSRPWNAKSPTRA
ncbi:hypothetical protein [Roseococcus sp.]|uniref:hypothetical protein n=1 Tax=Roseococcus sp. TaxID=2109646 RepID=UPI003BAC93A3